MTGSHSIDYMDTVSIAKDYEAIRIAMGDEPMNWLGVSYDTLLGSQYAELFPNNIRPMVIDGGVSISDSATATFVEAAAGSDAALKYFFEWCAQQNSTVCPIAYQTNGKTLEELWMELMHKVGVSSIPASTCPPSQHAIGPIECANLTLGVDQFRAATSSLLYIPSIFFPALSEAFSNAVLHHDGSGFVNVIPSPAQNDPAYDLSRSLFAFRGVVCHDWAHADVSAPDMQLKKAFTKSETPLLNGNSAAGNMQLDCIGFPGTVRNPPHRINIPASMNTTVLMVEAIYDNATPFVWGPNLREQIGKDRVALMIRDGGGHPTYEQPRGDSARAIEQYLLDLSLPQDGVVFTS